MIEYIRPKYVLKADTDDQSQKQVIIAPMPLLPIYKSMAGSSVLAEVLIGKYVYHLPFYRQIQQFRDLGVRLSSSTINDWFSNTSELLDPLYEKLRQKVLESDYIQADESTIPVIDRDKKKAEKEYIWVARAVKEKLLFFDYIEGSRSQATANKILGGFQGYLQSDAYDGYDVFNKYIEIQRLGCWAHARRHYSDSLNQDKELAEYALNLIQGLYAVERICTENGYDAQERQKKREELSLPIIEHLKSWAQANLYKVLPNSKIGKAMGYSIRQMDRLTIYIYNGELLIDNNLCENVIRPLAISRKNFLFCGNHAAAKNTAKILSILGSCKQHNINPRDYLINILDRLPYYIDQNKDLTELLPNEWIKRHPESIRLSDDVHKN